MEQKKLAALLRTKIAEEMKQFRNRMIKEHPEIIYGSAYQIDMKLNLCEILMEMSQKMTGDELRMLLGFPKLLAFLYSEWIRRSGGTPGREELRESIDESIRSLQRQRAVMENEITEEGAA